MTRLVLFTIITASMMLVWVSPGNAQPTAPTSEYRLSLRFNPGSNFIAGKATIAHASGPCFYLSSALKIERASADHRLVEVHPVDSASVPGSNEICFDSKKFTILEIEYSGRLTVEAIRKSTTQTNIIEPKLVELSNFVDWYPRMKQGVPARYRLDVDMPAQFVTVANGMALKETVGKGRIRSAWESIGSGITLVAAPKMKKVKVEQGGTRIEIYYDKLPQTYVDSMGSDLLAAMRSLQEMFGTRGSNDLVRLVYAPRGAGGYARAPLFVVSEAFALEQMPHRFGPARDLRFNVHETAHYWSRADVGTADDWINEGVAEFAALLVSEELSGKEFADLLLGEYRETVYNAPTTHSVLETESGSWEANVNRYYKPTLLLNDLRQQYGDAQIRRFLRALYARFKEDQTATTAAFLDEVEGQFGKAARDEFAKGLTRKTWTQPNKPQMALSANDPDFLGTWTGVLIQSGTPYGFVMHMKSDNGVLVATLDSPDQNVKDIPVAEVSIAGETLTMKVTGVAPASYKSRIDRANHTLSGEWVQMGISYPLNLKRSEQ